MIFYLQGIPAALTLPSPLSPAHRGWCPGPWPCSETECSRRAVGASSHLMCDAGVRESHQRYSFCLTGPPTAAVHVNGEEVECSQ